MQQRGAHHPPYVHGLFQHVQAAGQVNALDRDAIFDAIADGPVPIAEIPVQAADDEEQEQDEDEERETPGAKAQARQQPSREGGGGGSWWSWTRKWLTCVYPYRKRAFALALKGLGTLAYAG